MKLNLKVFMMVILVAMSGCCLGNPDCVVSPNRMKTDTLAAELPKIKVLLEPNSIKKLEVIGHGAGSFRHYPMSVNGEGKIEGNTPFLSATSKAENIDDLIRSAFDIKHIDAVEIDALVLEVDHEICKNLAKEQCAFVLHDELKVGAKFDPNLNSDESGYSYMRKNTVYNVLQSFVEKDYVEREKHLYLEVKCLAEPGVFLSCAKRSERVAEIVSKVIQQSKKPGTWLTVISFWPEALYTVHDELNKQNIQGVQFALVAGFDEPWIFGIKETLAQCKGDVPQFSENMETFVLRSQWLDKVWFSLKGIANPNEMFKNIITQRPDIEFSVSHYDKSPTKFKKGMKDFPKRLASFMIDVDD